MGFMYLHGSKRNTKSLTKKDLAFDSQKDLLAKRGKDLLKDSGVPPQGPNDADIYILLGAVSNNQLKRGTYYRGNVAKILREAFGRDFLLDDCRISSVIRSHVINDNADVTPQELEQWRLLTEEDIENTAPKIVFAVGGVALRMLYGTADTMGFHGRKIPIKVGKHECWLMPLQDTRIVIEKEGFGENPFKTAFISEVDRYLDEYENGLLGSPTIFCGDPDEGIVNIFGESIEDFHRVEDAFNSLLKMPLLGLDFECQNLRPYNSDSRLLTAAIGTYEETYSFPVDHPYAWTNKTRKNVIGLLGEFLNQCPQVIAHNATMEQEWLAYYYGFEAMNLCQWHDTMAAAYVLDSRKGHLSLDACVRYNLGLNLKVLAGPINYARMVKEPIPKVVSYNGRDTKWTFRLFTELANKLKKDNLYHIYEEKISNTASLTGMQLRGLPVDTDTLRSIGDKLSTDESNLTTKLLKVKAVKKFREAFGEPFNFASSEHCKYLFSTMLGRPEVTSTSPEGKVTISCNEEALASIKGADASIAQLVLDLRGVTKLTSTYIKPFLTCADDWLDRSAGKKGSVYPDGLIHPHYNGLFTATGRLSSSDPNAQNFPKRKYKYIREFVKPPKGFVIASLDFGQIEARVFAMFSKDPFYTTALWDDLDVHLQWAENISREYSPVFDWIQEDFEESLDDLITRGKTEEQALLKVLRQEVKNKWVFPQFYGASFRSCAESLRIPLDTGEYLQEAFWDEFKGIKEWQQESLEEAYRNGYVTTHTGFRRYFPMNKQVIINTRTQGTACEIVLGGLKELSMQSVVKNDKYFHPIMQIHDDLSFILPESEWKDRVAFIAECMLSIYKSDPDFITVPLSVECECGPDWYNQKVYKEFKSSDFGHIR